MAIKAIHIEPVSCLTSDGFIAALRRFIARRIYCDNGTNFVGASRELAEIIEETSEDFSKNVSSELTQNSISFHFSPAGSPHFNGLAEAAVKSTKSHLKKSIGDVAPTFEELATVLYQIEAAINSRPLCAVSTDPNEMTALTPAHFLTIGSMSTVPCEDFLETNINWLSRWKLVQRITQQFWRRWQDEYLHSLQIRKRWNTSKPVANINDLVLIKDENLPSTKWPLARIVAKHPGSDGKTRVVTVKTANSTLKRAITKIAPLPDQVNKKTQATTVGKKLTCISIITAMLAITMAFSTPTAAEELPIKVHNFEKPPIIHFEKTDDCFFTHTQWKMVAYFNLDHYARELFIINNSTLFMKEQCNTKLKEFPECLALVNNIESKIVRTLDKSAIQIKILDKRAILDIVGNIAADLFGVLDSRFAREYASDQSLCSAERSCNT